MFKWKVLQFCVVDNSKCDEIFWYLKYMEKKDLCYRALRRVAYLVGEVQKHTVKSIERLKKSSSIFEL